jgi:hypothetical protein
MTTAEIWRYVADFDEGLYQVAPPDRVRSLDRIVWQMSRWGHPVANRHHGRELTPYVCENGRKRVVLHDAAHRRQFGSPGPSRSRCARARRPAGCRADRS